MPITLTPAQCARAASAYRALIRAQRLTFKGDDLALQAAHQQTRILFHRFIPSSSASVSPFQRETILPPPDLAPKSDLTPEVVDEHINGAFEIATFLRKNVVQGVRNDEGNFALRIHEETERGDNDSIKQKKSAAAPAGGARRRRRRGAAGEAEAEADAAPVGCCGGAGAA
ncbi:hypothetical protein DMC30DRAFT_417144 [Rhodotorula diobovata]|uniref:Mitochondrial zinc maintenance protein 1, mitochondrial n=1 Tax=Rhodotorula diobovata TaxID=5288 RepID=A0A5C5FVK4_9BASI|nr:hypothetical protein DMC30DRAFT_417144 [Rhodotorula diobovata]